MTPITALASHPVSPRRVDMLKQLCYYAAMKGYWFERAVLDFIKNEYADKSVGKIAGFYLDDGGLVVVVNRGERNGVKLGDMFFILNGDTTGNRVALIEVFEVQEKMSLTRELWVRRCPSLKVGWHVWLAKIDVEEIK